MGYIVHWKDGTSSEMDDKQFENMPKEMESEIGKVAQTTADGFTDTVKSSPMSAAELEQFYKENPDLRDEMLKYAPGLPSVQGQEVPNSGDALSNIVADIPNTITGTYGMARRGMSALAAPIIGGWNTMTGKYGNIGNPEQLPYAQAVGNAYTKGVRGEGIPGLVANPMNLTMLAPGLGEYVVGGRLASMGGTAGKAGALAAENPIIARGLAGGVEGAGYTAAQAALDPDLEQSTGANLLGAGIGAGFGLGGGVLRKVANESFPGIKVINKKLDRSGGQEYTNAELEAFRRDASKLGKRSNVVRVSGLGRMENLEDSYRRQASELYENALDQVEPKVDPTNLQIQRDLRATQASIAAQAEKDAFMKRLAARFDRSIASRSGTPEVINLDNERILEGIKQKLSNDLFITNKARRLNLTEDEMSRYVDDVVERLRTRAAKHPGGSADLAEYTLTPRDVMSTKQILNEDIYNTGVGEVTARQRTMAKSLHQSVDKLFDEYRTVSGKPFKEELGEGAQLYKKSARLEDLLQEGKYRGGSYRVGGDAAKYFKLDPMYGLNDLTWRAGYRAPAIARGVNAALTPTTSDKKSGLGRGVRK